VPDRLVALVNRLLAPNPDDRPQRGQDVAAELADIALQHGLSGSSPGVAYVLSQLFPGESGGFEPQGTGRGTVRVVPDEGTVTQREKSPSVTPGSGSTSTSNRRLAPLDVSETYRRRTGELSIPSGSDLSRSLSPLVPTGSGATSSVAHRARRATRDPAASIAATLPPAPSGSVVQNRAIILVLIAVPFAAALVLLAYVLYGG
jgi:hypothetical protein